MAILSKTNITTSEVASALGATTHNVGALCTHPNIRPWAKYKPVIRYTPSVDYNTYWKAENGQCGLHYNVVNSYKVVEREYQDPLNWTHEKPTADDYKRLGDFRGYYTEATAPTKGVIFPTTKVDNGQGGKVMFTLMSKGSTHPNELSFNDLKGLGDGYFGVYVEGDNKNDRATASDTIGNGGTIVEISTTGYKVGKWKAVPFIALKNSMGQEEIDKDNLYISVPNANVGYFEVVNSNLTFFVSAKYVYPDSVECTIRITSGRENALFSMNVVQLRYPSSNFYTPLDVYRGEQEINMEDWKIDYQHPSLLTRTVTFRNVRNDLMKSAKVIVSLDGHNYEKQSAVIGLSK